MKYIITGGSGLIGKELVKRLSERGDTCIENFDVKEGDACYKDVKTISYFEPKQKVDCLFHLAAKCKINKCIEYPRLAKENVDNIYEVMEFCRREKIPKIVYFSSSRVLSKEKNSYTASKIYGEELVKAYHDCYGIDYLIIRPSTVYGKGDTTSRLMDIWVNNAKEDKDLFIHGDKDKTLSFTYLDDFIDGIEFALQGKWNRAYNIAGDEEKLSEVAYEIIKQIGSKSRVTYSKEDIAQPQKVSFKSDFYCPTRTREGIKCLI